MLTFIHFIFQFNSHVWLMLQSILAHCKSYQLSSLPHSEKHVHQWQSKLNIIQVLTWTHGKVTLESSTFKVLDSNLTFVLTLVESSTTAPKMAAVKCSV